MKKGHPISERDLWQEVLTLALEDAARYGDQIRKADGVTVRNSLSYFDSRDCALVHEYAGVGESIQSSRAKAHAMREQYVAAGEPQRTNMIGKLMRGEI